MGSTVRVQMNGRGARELLRSKEVADDLERRAERVVDQARATAPVSDEDDGLHYRDHIRIDMRPAPSRARARVFASVNYATAVEAKHGTLGRALDAAAGDS